MNRIIYVLIVLGAFAEGFSLGEKMVENAARTTVKLLDQSIEQTNQCVDGWTHTVKDLQECKKELDSGE